MKKIKFKLQLLLVSNLLAWSIIFYFVISGFAPPGKTKSFTAINAERVNIVGENGKPVLVLSNKRLIPGPAMNGKTYPREYADSRELFSGIIFF